MNYAMIKDNICTNVIVINDASIIPTLETAYGCQIVECPEGRGIGDTYDETWITPVEPELAPEEQREHAYETMAIVPWEGKNITVDAANDLWLKYSAEGSSIANTLSALIVTAKATIREMYPDEEAN